MLYLSDKEILLLENFAYKIVARVTEEIYVKGIIQNILAFVLKSVFWFRYKVTIKGLDELKRDMMS